MKKEVIKIAPTSQKFTDDQIKRLTGVAYPLMKIPVNNTYTLQGQLTSYIVDDLELIPNFLIKALGTFEFYDARGNIQKITIPLVIENNSMRESVYFDSGYSPELTTPERITKYVDENLTPINTDARETVISFAMPQDVKDAPYSQVLLKVMIEKMHPNKLDKFAFSGNPEELGNPNNWLIPMDVLIK